jgi:GT2 family glycosyltransferase
LAAQTVTPDEIIVIDNRSPRSGEIGLAVAEFPGVRLIHIPENRGFTGGMNAGLREVTNEYVLIVEDDMVLRPGCLLAFQCACESEPNIGVASGLILKESTDVIHYAGGDVSLDGIYHFHIRGAGERYRGQFSAPYHVSYVTGAMIFARTDYLRRLGGFRDDFFMYLEDVEFCLRVTRTGRRLLIVPAAIAEHFQPPPGRPSELVEFHQAKNLPVLYLLHARARVLPEFAFRYGLLALARSLVSDRRRFVALARGWWYVLTRLRSLYRERHCIQVAAKA